MLTEAQRNTINTRLWVLNQMKSADEIADYFVAAKIKGKRNYPAHCPVANYLSADLPVMASVSQLSYSIMHFGSDPGELQPGDLIIDRHWQNHAIYAFVTGFDDGQFPELDEGYEATRPWYAPWRRVWRKI